MKFIALGTNGFIPSHGRQTTSFLFFSDDSAVILDTGTGFGRILQKDILSILCRYSYIDIFLTHLHLDHTCGLPYLASLLDLRIKFRLFVPGKPFIDVDGKSALQKLVGPPFFSLKLSELTNIVEINEVITPYLRLDSRIFSFIRLKHDGGSMGVKLNEDFAFITDTVVDHYSLPFIRNVRFLFHEVWQNYPTPGQNRHSDFQSIKVLLSQTNVNTLVPIHLNPNWSPNELEDVFASSTGLPFRVLLPRESFEYSMNL
jgi:ribonuclease BN (tRNA processing enzyme)